MEQYSFKEKVERYLKLEELTKSGLWEIDVRRNQLIWSDGMYEIYEISKSMKSVDLTELINSKVHPDDRDLVNTTLNKTFSTGEDYHIIHRILFEDGRVKYIKGSATCKLDKDGNVINVIGSAIDITVEKELENSLINKNIELESQNLILQHNISIYDLKATVEAIIQDKKNKQ